MSGLLVWKIIGYGIVIFFAIGICFTILRIVIAILLPFVLIGYFLISIVTYPMTLCLRALGYECRSLFQLGIDFWNNWSSRHAPSEGHYRQSTTNGTRYTRPERENSEQKPRPRKREPDPWEILGVGPEASNEAIIAAYRQKMMTNHPDKVANLDPELQVFATKRTVLIKEAYDKLMKA